MHSEGGEEEVWDTFVCSLRQTALSSKVRQSRLKLSASNKANVDIYSRVRDVTDAHMDT